MPTVTDDDEIPSDHPVFYRFEAAGYSKDALTDPGHITADDVSAGGWQLVRWGSHGVEVFDMTADDLREADWAPAGVAVEFGSRGAQRPIGFADQSGPVNSVLAHNSMKVLRAEADPSVVFFARREDREVPEMTERAAVEALGYWGSEGFMPRVTAEAIGDALGFDLSGRTYRDDPDVDGGEMVRAPHVARAAARAVLGESQSADSGISGHKKRRRQVFYRNLERLQAEYGIESE